MRIELLEALLEEALRQGAQEAEVFFRQTRTLSAEVKEAQPEFIKVSQESSYALRLIKDRRLGFSYSNQPERWREVLKAALQASEHTEADPHLCLPGPTQAPLCPPIYDPAIGGLGEEEALQKALQLEEAAKATDRRIRQVRSAQAAFSLTDTLVANTHGLRARYEATSAVAHLMAMAQQGGQAQMAWDFASSRFLQDVDFPLVGRRAAQKAVALLGARRQRAFKGALLLDAPVAAEFLSLLAQMLSAEAVQKGKSLLKDRVGQRLLSPLVDILDDGLLPRAPGSRPVDDEGSPCQRKTLVEAGTLRGFLHNAYTANRAGTRSTGNGLRPSAASPPGVAPTNLYIRPKGEAYSQEALLQGVSKGLLVLEAMGVHTADPISGEFSIGVSGLLIQGGRLQGPVSEAVVAGNVLQLFSNLRAVGDDLRFLGPVGSPSLLMEPVDISA
jgi:PmbA protein